MYANTKIHASTKNSQQEVYKVTGFSDVIESPVFYIILVLTFILGISSVFGFLQNPRKLKSVVDIINKKVAVHNTGNAYSKKSKKTQGVNRNKYSVLENLSASATIPVVHGVHHKVDMNRYSLLMPQVLPQVSLDVSPRGRRNPASFDYDITSKQFWSDLHVEGLDSNANSPSFGEHLLGAPLEKELSTQQGDFKYSMTDGLKNKLISL